MSVSSDRDSAEKGGSTNRPIEGLMPRHIVARHLPYFLLVAQEQHFHRAAALLNLTQSALSRRIQNLEQELGATLFHRGKNGASLTEAGKIFYEDARSILRDLDRAIGRVGAVTRGEEGRLRIGINESASRSKEITAAIHQYKVAWPGVTIDLFPMLSEEQIAALRADSIDAGFFYDLQWGEDFNDLFETLLIEEDPMVLALPASHPLARRDKIEMADLQDEPVNWPSPSRGRHLHRKIASAFHSAGFDPPSAVEVLTAEMNVNLVAAQLGLGFVSASQMVPPGVVLRRLSGFDLTLKLIMVWRRDSRRVTLDGLRSLLAGDGKAK